MKHWGFWREGIIIIACYKCISSGTRIVEYCSTPYILFITLLFISVSQMDKKAHFSTILYSYPLQLPLPWLFILSFDVNTS